MNFALVLLLGVRGPFHYQRRHLEIAHIAYAIDTKNYHLQFEPGIASSTLKTSKPRKFPKERKAKTSGMFLVERRNFSPLAEVRIELTLGGSSICDASPKGDPVPTSTSLLTLLFCSRRFKETRLHVACF